MCRLWPHCATHVLQPTQHLTGKFIGGGDDTEASGSAPPCSPCCHHGWHAPAPLPARRPVPRSPASVLPAVTHETLARSSQCHRTGAGTQREAGSHAQGLRRHLGNYVLLRACLSHCLPAAVAAPAHHCGSCGCCALAEAARLAHEPCRLPAARPSAAHTTCCFTVLACDMRCTCLGGGTNARETTAGMGTLGGMKSAGGVWIVGWGCALRGRAPGRWRTGARGDNGAGYG